MSRARRMTLTRRCWLGGPLMTLVIGATGCSSVSSLLPKARHRADWSEVILTASEDANRNAPLAVDLVLVRDDALQAKLLEMTAATWFAARAELLATFPQGVRVQSWEVVPGQRLRWPGERLAGPRIASAFLFARYAQPGAHRVRLERFDGRLTVSLGATAMTVDVER